MARYRLLERAYINERLYEEGEVAECAASLIPGPHMVPEDDEARAIGEQMGLINGPLGDPIEEITSPISGEKTTRARDTRPRAKVAPPPPVDMAHMAGTVTTEPDQF